LGARGSKSSVDSHDESMEVTKDLQKNCSSVMLTLHQNHADHTVRLNRESKHNRGLRIKDIFDYPRGKLAAHAALALYLPNPYGRPQLHSQPERICHPDRSRACLFCRSSERSRGSWATRQFLWWGTFSPQSPYP
jgi:hypothetical protein